MWDQRYNSEDYAYGKEPNSFLKERGHLIPPGKVLSIADGEGRNGVYLAREGYEVTAVDSSAVGLTKARALALENNTSIHTIHADLDHFAFEPGHWNGIVSIFCHLPQQLRKKVHQKVISSLAPGGLFILEAYTPHQLDFNTGGPPTLNLLYSLKDLKEDLAGLHFVHAVETTRSVVEGRLHTGKAAVVQLIAQKQPPSD